MLLVVTGEKAMVKSEAVGFSLFLVGSSLMRLSFLICRMGTSILLSQIYHVAQTHSACETIN